MPVAYSTLRRPGGPKCAAPATPGKAVNHRDRDGIHDGVGGLIVKDGHAAHLAVLDRSPHMEFFQALHAREHEEIRAQHIDPKLASRGLLLVLLVHQRKRGAGLAYPEGFDLDLALRRRPAGAARAGRLVRGLPGRHAEPCAGDGIVDHGPADLALLGLDGGGEERALLWV
jgi:hypothetical protein